MRSLNSVGLGLSLVFGCLLLALVAELYYLLWWKKRFSNREIEDDYSSSARELLYMFCWKKPSSLSSTALNPQELVCSSVRITEPEAHELHRHSNNELLLKPFGDDADDGTVENELMRLHELSGPPRFLFTIKEETKEDLESEDGKSRKVSRNRSLSDLLLTVETPYLTPLSSPPFFTPPLTPMDSSSYNHQGFNPLFESSTDAEFKRIRSSPPPKFKFLKDAEEKLHKRKLMEEADEGVKGDVLEAPPTSKFVDDEEDGSFITIIVAKNKESNLQLDQLQHLQQQYQSSSSQVLPLASSPSTFRPPANEKPIFYTEHHE